MRQLLNSLVDVGFAMILCLATDLSGKLPKFCYNDNHPEFYNVSFIKAIDCRIVNRNNPAFKKMAI